MSVTGLPGQGPVRVGIPIADLCAGIFAAYGVTVALLEREALGQGPVAAHLAAGGDDLHDGFPDRALDRSTARSPAQAGNFHPTSIPTGVYKTRDGYINIAVFGGKIWERFCRGDGRARVDHRRALEDQGRALGAPRLAQRRDRAAPGSARPATTGSRSSTRRAWPAGASTTCSEAFEEPQVKHLGMVQGGGLAAPRRADAWWASRSRSSARPRTIARAAPRRGEHTEEILAEAGYRRRRARAHESRRSLLMNDMTTYASPTERVKTWLEGRVLHIRFNNPAKHNALSVDMWEAVPPLLGAGARTTTTSAWWCSPARARRPSSPAPTSRSSRTCAPRRRR